MSNQEEYQKYYSEHDFWQKVKEFAKAAGKDVVERSLQLYYALQSVETPTWAKAVIYAALGYFILPIDAIPDILPLVGFTDDLGALTAAITAVSLYINDDVKQQAQQKLLEWFGE